MNSDRKKKRSRINYWRRGGKIDEDNFREWLRKREKQVKEYGFPVPEFSASELDAIKGAAEKSYDFDITDEQFDIAAFWLHCFKRYFVKVGAMKDGEPEIAIEFYFKARAKLAGNNNKD